MKPIGSEAPVPSYAAVLREVANSMERPNTSDWQIARVAQLRALADLLDDIRPEENQGLGELLSKQKYQTDEWIDAYRVHCFACDLLRGPQPEEVPHA